MDWITFGSRAIEALAWPVATLILALIFRKEVLSLLPNIRKFKAGPLEAEFELATKDVLVNATQTAAQVIAVALPSKDEAVSDSQNDIVDKLLDARSNPSGTILEGWSRVDGELFQLGVRLEILADPLTSTATVYDTVMATDVLPSATGRLVRELRDLRNQVAHGKVVPSVNAAQDYLIAVDRVVELIKNYRKNLPR